MQDEVGQVEEALSTSSARRSTCSA